MLTSCIHNTRVNFFIGNALKKPKHHLSGVELEDTKIDQKILTDGVVRLILPKLGFNILIRREWMNTYISKPQFEEQCFGLIYPRALPKNGKIGYNFFDNQNIQILLYRIGNNGNFLGVGGTFDLYEDKAVDVEILASGVIIGYLLYNLSVAITFGVVKERLANDCLMNIIGIFLWLGVAGTALHYWHSYRDEWRLKVIGTERDVGLAMGSICVFNGILHGIDAAVSLKLFLKQDEITYRTRSH